MVHAFTLTEVIYQLDFTLQFTLSDPRHIGGLIYMYMRLDTFAVPGVALE